MDTPLVSTAWLADRLDDPSVVVLDASFKLPGTTPSAREDFKARHIPNARFFDVDLVADLSTDLPHMAPNAEEFARAAGGLGVSNDTHVVVYDTPGLMSAGRAWWMFRLFGHERVSVLNGGLRKWQGEERRLTNALLDYPQRIFSAVQRPELIRSKDQMVANLSLRREQVVDARSPGRFSGQEPEPRPGLRSGHIPGSLNLPYGALTDPTSGELVSTETLVANFRNAGLALDKPIVATCGSGVTACALALGLAVLGRWDVAVYDGAWAEWGLTQSH